MVLAASGRSTAARVDARAGPKQMVQERSGSNWNGHIQYSTWTGHVLHQDQGLQQETASLKRRA